MSWVKPAGTAASGRFDVELLPGGDLNHAGVQTVRLDENPVELPADGLERLLVPLDGRARVRLADGAEHLIERAGTWLEAAPDVLYLPAGTGAAVTGTGTLVIATAPGGGDHAVAHRPANVIGVLQRGTAPATRTVRDLAGEDTLDAHALLVCEVVTPAGGWSSWPPHKHDVDTAEESDLEEVYLFDMLPAGPLAGSGEPVGLHRTFASDEREIDVLTEIRPGDVALVPWGWHGPCVAPPGHSLYYLNVMAGPHRRTWKVTYQNGVLP